MTEFEKYWGIYKGNVLAKLFPVKIPQYFSHLVILHTYLSMKMEQTECSETSAYNIQTPENYPEESIQHSEHGESLKSIINYISHCDNTISYHIPSRVPIFDKFVLAVFSLIICLLLAHWVAQRCSNVLNDACRFRLFCLRIIYA